MLVKEYPEINKRIKQIIDTETNGNKTAFGRETGIKQQRISRLFVKDKKTGMYPVAATDILTSILKRYKKINARWLLTGEGYMTKKIAEKKILEKNEIVSKEKDYIIELQKDVIKSLKEQINFLKKEKRQKNS